MHGLVACPWRRALVRRRGGFGIIGVVYPVAAAGILLESWRTVQVVDPGTSRSIGAVRRHCVGITRVGWNYVILEARIAQRNIDGITDAGSQSASGDNARHKFSTPVGNFHRRYSAKACLFSDDDVLF